MVASSTNLLFVLFKSCFILVGDIQPLASLANPAFLLSSPKQYSSIRATVTTQQKMENVVQEEHLDPLKHRQLSVKGN